MTVILRNWTDTKEAPLLDVSETNLELAKAFLLERWQERARRLKRERPASLENACKFAALFAVKLFGGDLRGNWYHVYAVCGNPERIVDLTDAAGVGPEQRPAALAGRVPEFRGALEHDEELWAGSDSVTSVLSCAQTAWKWADQFRFAHPELYAGGRWCKCTHAHSAHKARGRCKSCMCSVYVPAA